MSVSVSPANGAYDLSPTVPVLILGSAPGETFDYSTLVVTVGGEPAYRDGAPVRPDFFANLVPIDEAFTLTVTCRRAFVYRVKVTVTVAVDTDVRTYTASSSFEVRPRSVPLIVGAARNSFNNEAPVTGMVAIGSIRQQLRALLGGDTNGAFVLRALFRVRLSQLWPALKVILLRTAEVDVEGALRAMRDEDVRVVGDVTRTLGLIEIFWHPALSQFVELGGSKSMADLFDRGFRSENDLERIGAACALALTSSFVAEQGQRDPAGLAQVRANGLV